MENRSRQLITFFVLAYAFSWFFWLFDVLDGLKIISLPFSYMFFFIIGAHGPLFAAIVLTGQQGGWSAVKSLLKAGFDLRISLKWGLVILVLPAVLSGAALWLNVSLNHFQFDQTMLAQPLLILPNFLIMFFLGGSVQEEFGWRGYALPQLLEKWNPLISSLILGAVWGFWHLPLFFIPNTGQFYMSLGIFLLLTEAFAILITWVYLRTGWNLFSALLFHTSINAILSVFPPIEKVAGGNKSGMIYLLIAYAAVALVVVIKERALFSSPAPEAY